MKENEISFSKAKFPHTYEIRKVPSLGLRNLSEKELNEMDPNNFLQSALKKYGDANLWFNKILFL